MIAKRVLALVALLALGTVVACVMLIQRSTEPDTSDGAAAIANVANLRTGMTMAQTIATLHADRHSPVTDVTTSHRASANGREQIHALARDRYVVLWYTEPKAPGGTLSLKRWELHNGRAPREDVIFGRTIRIGGWRMRY